ncbi:MAG: Tim44/TimA family putative adaptor protein [Alphaproteobacteria bacterium]
MDVPFLDIVVFGAIAAFLVLRLRSVLGRRTGHERPPTQGLPAARPGVSRRTAEEPARANGSERPPAAAPANGSTAMAPAAESGLARISLADRSFTPDSFLAGASAAFTAIVTAFAAGDRDTLRDLLSESVARDFEAAIDAREKNNATQQTEIVAIDRAEIAEAGMDGTLARVVVAFTSRQKNATLDSEGRIIAGDPNEVVEVADEWTFARDTRSSDPNWALVATRSPA